MKNKHDFVLCIINHTIREPQFTYYTLWVSLFTAKRIKVELRYWEKNGISVLAIRIYEYNIIIANHRPWNILGNIWHLCGQKTNCFSMNVVISRALIIQKCVHIILFRRKYITLFTRRNLLHYDIFPVFLKLKTNQTWE